MSKSAASIKVALGRNYVYLIDLDLTRRNFFHEKLDKLRYYFCLSYGFRLPEVKIVYDNSLQKDAFCFFFNEIKKYDGEANPDDIFAVSDDSDFVFSAEEYILFELFQALSMSAADFFDREVFLEWTDDPAFYRDGKFQGRNDLYGLLKSALTKNLPVFDRQAFLAGKFDFLSGIDEDKEIFDADSQKLLPFILKALFLLSAGKISKSFSMLEPFSGLDAGKDIHLVLHLYAEIFLYQGRKDEAIVYFKKCSDLCVNYKNVLYMASLLAFESGDPYKCNQLISCANELYPGDMMFGLLYSRLLIETGRASRGARELEFWLEKADIFPGALCFGASFFIDDYEKAFSLLKQAGEINPDHFQTRFMLACLFYINNMYGESLHELDQLLASGIENAEIFNQRGKVLLQLESFEQAELDLKRAALMDEEFIFSLAEYYIALNDFNRAAPLIDETLRNEPFHIKANEYKANFAVNSGDFEQALKIYAKLQFICPDNLEYMLSVAELKIRLGEQSGAQDLLLQVKEVSPDNEILAELLGWLYLEQGSLDKAEEIFDNIISLGDCENLLILYGKATVAFKRALYEESRALALRCISIAPDCDSAMYLMSKLCSISGDNKEALKFIRKALKLVPGSSIYLEQKAALMEH